MPIEGAYGFAQQTLPLLTSGTTHPPTLLFSSLSGDSYYEAVNENALIALSRSLGREFGPKGVHVGHVRVRRTGDADGGNTAASHVRILPWSKRLNCACWINTDRVVGFSLGGRDILAFAYAAAVMLY